MNGQSITIILDFDGTVVKHEFPEIGADIGAVPILKKLIANGHKLILFTMRSGKYLQDAVEWFENNDIKLYGIQRNPEQDDWTTSPKAFGDLIIDDTALGVPLVNSPFARSYIDWREVEKMLKSKYLI